MRVIRRGGWCPNRSHEGDRDRKGMIRPAPDLIDEMRGTGAQP